MTYLCLLIKIKTEASVFEKETKYLFTSYTFEQRNEMQLKEHKIGVAYNVIDSHQSLTLNPHSPTHH